MRALIDSVRFFCGCVLSFFDIAFFILSLSRGDISLIGLVPAFGSISLAGLVPGFGSISLADLSLCLCRVVPGFC